MIEKITKFLYENNVRKINEIIDAVNALGINTPQNTASVIQQYINSLVSSVETGTANGTISVTIGNTKTDVAIKGLQSAAYRSEDYFATNSHQHTSNEINKMTGYAKPSVTSAIGTNDTLNTAIGKLERALDSKQGSGNYATVSHTHSNYVPTSRTVNNKALTTNITLSYSDVGAAAAQHDQASNTITVLTGYSKPSTTSAIAATDALNTALGKLEKALDNKLDSNDTIAKATADAAGNNIQTTYATKAELNAAQIDTSAVDLSGYAPLAHNQASDTINAMTGYVKPNATSAIAASDTLNTALGKLEKALDGLSSKVDQSDVGNEAGKIPRYSAEGHLILPSGIELF